MSTKLRQRLARAVGSWKLHGLNAEERSKRAALEQAHALELETARASGAVELEAVKAGAAELRLKYEAQVLFTTSLKK